MKIENKLTEMGLTIPPAPEPVGKYVPAVRSGNLLYISGHGPHFEKDGRMQFIRGKVGRDLSLDEGYEAAKLVALNLLRVIKNATGDLD